MSRASLGQASLGLLAGAMFTATAFAQTTIPSPGARFTNVPADAALSYNLVGLNVYNSADENVGEIKDIIISKDKLDGYILSVGGWLGMGEHYVAVEPSSVAVGYDAAKGKWAARMNATKDQLKGAPEFKYQGRWKSSS
nr:PRC-barrel domain-containing protein [Methylocapsa palsarum]